MTGGGDACCRDARAASRVACRTALPQARQVRCRYFGKDSAEYFRQTFRRYFWQMFCRCFWDGFWHVYLARTGGWACSAQRAVCSIKLFLDFVSRRVRCVTPRPTSSRNLRGSFCCCIRSFGVHIHLQTCEYTRMYKCSPLLANAKEGGHSMS